MITDVFLSMRWLMNRDYSFRFSVTSGISGSVASPSMRSTDFQTIESSPARDRMLVEEFSVPSSITPTDYTAQLPSIGVQTPTA